MTIIIYKLHLIENEKQQVWFCKCLKGLNNNYDFAFKMYGGCILKSSYVLVHEFCYWKIADKLEFLMQALMK